ncbi:MAG: hexosyltransferase [Dehalococcoidia bacterium]|jgi:glycosyltransferase involved in cell wall biosynthesis|nr:MAG: hexosyltransferase [Dehalococcoidia bacterium]
MRPPFFTSHHGASETGKKRHHTRPRGLGTQSQLAEQTLAFVLPWYGEDAIGGAESLARATAERLAATGVPVEVLTTCARDQFSGWWNDWHRPGVRTENGVVVRRFPLRKQIPDRFAAINERLIAGERVSREEEHRFFEEFVNSDALYRYIAREQARYQFLFLPYFFSTTFFGARIAPARSWIIPCLHDEGYARMTAVRELFATVRGLILLSEPERQLVEALYGLPDERVHLWGAGVETTPRGNAMRFRAKYGIDRPFLLYVGRLVPTKNTPLLLDYFVRYALSREELLLVLAGPGETRLPVKLRDRIIRLGAIDEETKHDAYAAALATVQPSVRESFSLVLMESWVEGTPVLVNERCAVTRHFALASGGGLPFATYAEFAALVEYLLTHPAARDALGARGRAYVLRNFAWPTILERYRSLLAP